MGTVTHAPGSTETALDAAPPSALPSPAPPPRAVTSSLSFDPVVRGLPCATFAELLASAIGRVAARFAPAKASSES